mmetsp:Transcript_6988/g.14604  ORF Transcript_6988/g.14604 Transcript_6988/m.14604 type:complete len:335 (-) Transcript_6988:23-1027(-)
MFMGAHARVAFETNAWRATMSAAGHSTTSQGIPGGFRAPVQTTATQIIAAAQRAASPGQARTAAMSAATSIQRGRSRVLVGSDSRTSSTTAAQGLSRSAMVTGTAQIPIALWLGRFCFSGWMRHGSLLWRCLLRGKGGILRLHTGHGSILLHALQITERSLIGSSSLQPPSRSTPEHGGSFGWLVALNSRSRGRRWLMGTSHAQRITSTGGSHSQGRVLTQQTPSRILGLEQITHGISTRGGTRQGSSSRHGSFGGPSAAAQGDSRSHRASTIFGYIQGNECGRVVMLRRHGAQIRRGCQAVTTVLTSNHESGGKLWNHIIVRFATGKAVLRGR